MSCGGFIHSTGIKDGAIQFVLDLPDAPGSVTKVIECLRKFNARVISVLTSFEDAPEGKKRVAVRVMINDAGQEEAMTRELRETFAVVYHGKDELKKTCRANGLFDPAQSEKMRSGQ